jgi:putative Ca2+/H+ antiporter (TMEM165/GDT1 family)
VNIALALTVFGVIFVAELPDKTMIATVVMGSRSRALPVWLGASVAFILHMALAVVAGRFMGRLPHRLLELVVTIFFLGGAAYLLLVPEKAELVKGEAEAEVEAERPGPFLGIAATAFAVIFLGEFGDLTQILAANFAARSHQPLTVFGAGTLALISVSALAASGGRALLKVLPLSRIRLGGGLLLAAFGIYSLVTTIRG